VLFVSSLPPVKVLYREYMHSVSGADRRTGSGLQALR
jgi:hypothetical protein